MENQNHLKHIMSFVLVLTVCAGQRCLERGGIIKLMNYSFVCKAAPGLVRSAKNIKGDGHTCYSKYFHSVQYPMQEAKLTNH